MPLEPSSPIEQHNHDGINSPRIDPRDLISKPILTAAPTHAGYEKEEAIALIGGVYYSYRYLGGAWHYITYT
jgi:hypothetical protein